MIFVKVSLKGIFGQNMSDLPNRPLKESSRPLQAAVLNRTKTLGRGTSPAKKEKTK